MKPLVYWARAEGWRFRPTHKTEATISGTLIAPDSHAYAFTYHRQALTLHIQGGPLHGQWQLDEWGFATRRDDPQTPEIS